VTRWPDSSFVVSIYVEDRHSARARRCFAEHTDALLITPFSRGEIQHAIRMCAFRREISGQEMAQALLRFEHDQGEGFFEMAEIDFATLIDKAIRLSHRYTLTHGVRYLDLLHVAAATLAKSRQFLTFDLRQAKLAKAAGLNVRP
jgi:predicted nucleic acid-binding protein